LNVVGMPSFLRQFTAAVSTAAAEFHTQSFPLFSGQRHNISFLLFIPQGMSLRFISGTIK
ncbi:TPA: hypothetical protein I3M88_004672, partial [Salmonella enterica subsp. enterica serovar 4,[5],12:i:-]|nr:hypothetical protein [Salmonella enterica subsp. enterica serovar 4,[5],12:i:-]